MSDSPDHPATTRPDPVTAPSCCGRRDALRAVGAVAVVGAGLTACGTDAGKAVETAASSASSAASGAAGAVRDLAKKADIPVGGGTIIDAAKVVITQPTEGEFKAFSAVCTHQGCTVSSVEGGAINCACHGSQFDLATGAVKRGPATRGLPTKSVTVGADGISVT
ncbi:Rieske (2Fe-2S) protein [Knoellia aerolata]|uniref:Cytochrome bc1 complex Rieske iron-sulfur subunit n=1 Tax=Knoellia aerolata DSM 18566 TaxID=1385519 RepID=A0A0A0K4K0_9MICO|nr:Rieske (2Fe-2S) protein [Knoellia aerolata]KGN42751.1 iron-sulfur protein [Knoellia aerolata DSM 18566]